MVVPRPPRRLDLRTKLCCVPLPSKGHQTRKRLGFATVGTSPGSVGTCLKDGRRLQTAHA